MKFPSPSELTRIRKDGTDEEAIYSKCRIVREKHGKLSAETLDEAWSIFLSLPDMLREEAKSKWYLKIDVPSIEIGNVLKDFVEACGIVGYKVQITNEQDKITFRIMW